MKEYELRAKSQKLKAVYHIDAYRVSAEDILSLGFEEIISNSENVVIIEWPERVREIIPKNAVWIKFEWLDEEKRKLILEKEAPERD
jgi:tRNA threonylcarbamoyladenosine biosynthesis protein TsaE